jgi:hypothetical protein
LSEEKPPLSDAIRHLAEQERRSLTEHPTPGELSAYHAGTLSSEAEARVREHLSLCRHCSDLLLDLAGFADLAPPPGVPELTDAEVEEDWQELRARLGEGEPAPVVPFPTSPAPPAPIPARLPVRRRPWRYAAAALVAAAVGLSAWMLIPKQQLPTKHLYEGSALRGEEESPLDSTLSHQPTAFHFYPESYPRYEGRILRDGKEVWKTSEVLPSENETVLFEIPADSLEPGRYQAVLYGLREGQPSSPSGSLLPSGSGRQPDPFASEPVFRSSPGRLVGRT